jgi:CheY-like chemotaxis protein
MEFRMYRVCFIDDDSVFEIALFKEVFGDIYNVVAEDSYDAAKKEISARGEWNPDLFVLDLYFPSGPPDQSAVAALAESTLELENDRGQIRTAYANHLRAKERLEAVLDAWRQGPDGGLEIANHVVVDFPGVPIVFYSRKATFEDAVRCMATDGVWGLQKKPTGSDDEDTRRLTLAEKPRLVSRFNAVIARENKQQTLAVKQAARRTLQFVGPML